MLASAAQAQGECEQAQHYAQQAYALTQQTGDDWFAPHLILGNADFALGDYSAARRHFESFYAIRKEFDDRGGMAAALNRLGDVALREGDRAQAQQLYHQALDLRRDVNDKGGRATSLSGLGQVALAVGDAEQARQHLREALQIAHEIDYAPLIFSARVGIGEVLLRAGKSEPGFDALALVEPLTERETEVLQLIADGRSNQEIANRLVISVGTVKAYTG